MRANRFQGVGYKSPRKYVCRVWNCHKKGYGRWCVDHMPDSGVGILPCLQCGLPLADHPLARRCVWG